MCFSGSFHEFLLYEVLRGSVLIMHQSLTLKQGDPSPYLVDKFVHRSFPLDEDLVEAPEAARVGDISRVGDGHCVTRTLQLWSQLWWSLWFTKYFQDNQQLAFYDTGVDAECENWRHLLASRSSVYDYYLVSISENNSSVFRGCSVHVLTLTASE